MKPLFLVGRLADGPLWLSDDADPDGDGRYSRPARKIHLQPDLVADYLDQCAESANAHDFVGAHKTLVTLLRKHVSEAKVTAIFHDLLEVEGLPGMEGVAGMGPGADAVAKLFAKK